MSARSCGATGCPAAASMRACASEPGDVGVGQAPVEVDRRVEALHALGHRLGEAPRPCAAGRQLRRRKRRSGQLGGWVGAWRRASGLLETARSSASPWRHAGARYRGELTDGRAGAAVPPHRRLRAARRRRPAQMLACRTPYAVIIRQNRSSPRCRTCATSARSCASWSPSTGRRSSSRSRVRRSSPGRRSASGRRSPAFVEPHLLARARACCGRSQPRLARLPLCDTARGDRRRDHRRGRASSSHVPPVGCSCLRRNGPCSRRLVFALRRRRRCCSRTSTCAPARCRPRSPRRGCRRCRRASVRTSCSTASTPCCRSCAASRSARRDRARGHGRALPRADARQPRPGAAGRRGRAVPPVPRAREAAPRRSARRRLERQEHARRCARAAAHAAAAARERGLPRHRAVERAAARCRSTSSCRATKSTRS